jgi:hypothetical protein
MNEPDDELEILYILRGSPRNPLLRRAITAYKRSWNAEHPRTFRNGPAPEPGGASASIRTPDGRIWVALDLPAGLRVYSTSRQGHVRQTGTYPAAIAARYAPRQ